jgi:hypothetical protein
MLVLHCILLLLIKNCSCSTEEPGLRAVNIFLSKVVAEIETVIIVPPKGFYSPVENRQAFFVEPFAHGTIFFMSSSWTGRTSFGKASKVFSMGVCLFPSHIPPLSLHSGSENPRAAGFAPADEQSLVYDLFEVLNGCFLCRAVLEFFPWSFVQNQFG